MAKRSLAVFFARVTLGLIFVMAGWWKVFELGSVDHARRMFVEPYADTWIPAILLWASGTVVPAIELVAGALLIVGWRIREASIALGAVLLLVTYGHLLKEPLYSFTGHVIPRLGLLIFVLWVPREEDRLSVDHWHARRRKAH
jgi:uncharacterized membrane protein YphA (DoxX/SURF4 family)